jgi:hypothetical protein
MRMSRWPVAASDADFAPYLAGRPETSVGMFWRFVELSRAAGTETFELQNGPIVLCGSRRIFATVRVRHADLDGMLVMTRRLADRRIRRADDFRGALKLNRFRVGSLSDLDDDFAGWLAEAAAVGDGAHLRR